ncbi:hypothetical protein JRQ81_010043 [Phrynocephalus forsythii]|uniref:Sulfotransferase n=1 Tax=Phrynocephalus forsythii TaxID=171643 RepID=A0A9Q1B6M2_9SAUR|nr:hypothetical protein JRQ81_010043 [Phrynocephalus forsythii]
MKTFKSSLFSKMLDFGTPEKFQNLYEGVKQIADFFEVPLPEEKIQSIAEKTTFRTMSSEAPQRLGGFAPIIFRKGVVGDWKTLFTEAQSQKWMQNLKSV